MKYQDLPETTIRAAAELLESGAQEDAASAIVSVSLHNSDRAAIETLLLRAAASTSPLIRGNALVGFGHVARRFGSLDRQAVEPLICTGLIDPDPYVRGHANSAVDDVAQFLGWRPGARG